LVEYTLLCQHCRNVFKLLLSQSPSVGGNILCPKCGSPDVAEAPVWAPLGSGLNIFDSAEWEYECHECHKKFKMPIPESPTQEKERSCPFCGAGHIHRLTAVGGEPLYCG
jgi:rRNA maturation endonuclease Nob1